VLEVAGWAPSAEGVTYPAQLESTTVARTATQSVRKAKTLLLGLFLVLRA
jgi:hypothetical protein